MRSDLIVDAGPLIALFDKDDQHHERVRGWYRGHWFRGYTTLAVVAEVAHSLSYRLDAQIDFLWWVRRGALRRVDLMDEDLERCIEVIAKYADLPADFADATLVAIAERLGVRDIFTLDGDFRVYKYRNRYAFRLPLLDEIQ